MTAKLEIDPEEIKAYIQLYQEGYTVQEIAVKFGISRTAVSRQMVKAGFTGFHHRGDRSPRRIEQRTLKLNQYARLYESGMSIGQIGKKMGIKPSTIHQAMRRNGYKKFRTPVQSRQLTLEVRNTEICVAYKMGLTLHEIAARFSLTAGSIRDIVRKSGVQKPRTVKQPRHPDIARKYWDYYEKGWSTTQIAQYFGVNESSVYKLFKNHGYRIRSISEGLKLKFCPELQRSIEDALAKKNKQDDL